jgi:hypothetical protein
LYSNFHLSLKPPLPHSICKLKNEIYVKRSWRIVRVLFYNILNLGNVFRTPILIYFHV